jgi:hypothetical protein
MDRLDRLHTAVSALTGSNEPSYSEPKRRKPHAPSYNHRRGGRHTYNGEPLTYPRDRALVRDAHAQRTGTLAREAARRISRRERQIVRPKLNFYLSPRANRHDQARARHGPMRNTNPHAKSEHCPDKRRQRGRENTTTAHACSPFGSTVHSDAPVAPDARTTLAPRTDKTFMPNSPNNAALVSAVNGHDGSVKAARSMPLPADLTHHTPIQRPCGAKLT